MKQTLRDLRAEILKISTFSCLGIILFWIALHIFGAWYDEWSGYKESTSAAISDGICNIAVLPIRGEIIPYAGAGKDGISSQEDSPPSANPDDILAMLRQAESDPNIAGILAHIDSPGGSAAAAESMANGFKNSSLPTAALIGEMGASAGYLAATGADVIIASPFSDIGSIGVTMSYLEHTAKNAKDGLRYVSLASGIFKDYLNPDKPLTPAERALLERDLKIYHDQFVQEVAENRNLPEKEIAKLADGSSMPGSLALQNKLIDRLGDQETARAWFAEKLQIPEEEVVFCE